ncbi:helix-turn-helix transcriptional regulator [Cohnella sp. WQ 127256]|uniref:helix-turn-helix transcriptional regulator n=1 Tax=Cohnella sp. WQ 127256 TaxID=2938790 RepID=UPI002117B5B8|nr:helix-turn-helix transcriptional regulator [Cohnella sp. WQ 127256]
MSIPILHFISPPVPYFIDSGKHHFMPGERHISRNFISVFDLIVVTKGTLFIGENSVEWTVRQGEALILRPDGYHYGTTPCQEETEITWIHFHTFGAWEESQEMSKCLENQLALIEKHKQNAYLNHCEVCSIFIPKHFKLSERSMDDLKQFYELDHDPRSLRNWKKQTAFQVFMQHIDRESASSSDAAAIRLAEKVELFIRQNYAKKLTNSMLQSELNYHPNHLAKCMLKIYGMTPIDYLQQYRIEQAKKLLLQTNWSIARIAEEVGFNTSPYFSTFFMNKEGISPSNFRRKVTGETK